MASAGAVQTRFTSKLLKLLNVSRGIALPHCYAAKFNTLFNSKNSGFFIYSISPFGLLNFILRHNGWRYVFVADFEAQICQVTQKFIRCKNAETRTISAIKYTGCYPT